MTTSAASLRRPSVPALTWTAILRFVLGVISALFTVVGVVLLGLAMILGLMYLFFAAAAQRLRRGGS